MKPLTIVFLLAACCYGSARNGVSTSPFAVASPATNPSSYQYDANLQTQASTCNLTLVNAWLQTVLSFVEEDKAIAAASSNKNKKNANAASSASIFRDSGKTQNPKVRVGNSAFGGLGLLTNVDEDKDKNNTNHINKNEKISPIIKANDPVLRIPMLLSISLESLLQPSGAFQSTLVPQHRRLLHNTDGNNANSHNSIDRNTAFQHYRRPYSAVLAYGREVGRQATGPTLNLALVAEEYLREAQKGFVDAHVKRRVVEAVLARTDKKENEDANNNQKQQTKRMEDLLSRIILPYGLTPFGPWVDCLPQLLDLPHSDLYKEKLTKIARQVALAETEAEAKAIEEKAKKITLSDEASSLATTTIPDEIKKERKELNEKRRDIVARVTKAMGSTLEERMGAFAEPRNEGTFSSPASALAISMQFRHIINHRQDTEREFKRIFHDTVVKVGTVSRDTLVFSGKEEKEGGGGSNGLPSSFRDKALGEVLKESLTQYGLCVAEASVDVLTQFIVRRRQEAMEKKRRERERDDDSEFFEDDDSADGKKGNDDDVANLWMQNLSHEDLFNLSMEIQAMCDRKIAHSDAAAEEGKEAHPLYKGLEGKAVWERGGVANAIVIPTTPMKTSSESDDTDSHIIEQRKSLKANLSRLFDKVFSYESFAKAATIHSSRAWNIRGQQFLVPVSDFFNYRPRDDEAPHLAAPSSAAVGSSLPLRPNEAVMKKRFFNDRSSDFLTHHHIRQVDGSSTFLFDAEDTEAIRSAQRRSAALSQEMPKVVNRRPAYVKGGVKVVSKSVAANTLTATRTAAATATALAQSTYSSTTSAGQQKGMPMTAVPPHLLPIAAESAGVVAYLVACKSEDDGGHGVDPKRPPTAIEQYFEVLADRNAGGRTITSSNNAPEELFESYGDSNNDIYFRFHGFSPVANPYECVQLSSYSVHGLATGVGSAASPQSRIRKRPPPSSSEYQITNYMGDILGAGSRGGSGGGYCIYNTTMYPYQGFDAAEAAAVTKNGGKGGEGVMKSKRGQSLIAPSTSSIASTIMKGELDPALLFWSIGAACFHGAAESQDQGANAEDAGNADQHIVIDRKADGDRNTSSIIVNTFVAKGRDDDAPPFISQFFKRVADCSIKLLDEERIRSQPPKNHGAFLSVFRKWEGTCGPSLPASLADIPSPSPNNGYDEVLKHFSRAIISAVKRQLGESVDDGEGDTTEVIGASVAPFAFKFAQIMFAKQQIAMYRALLINSFKQQHASSNTAADEEMLGRRSELVSAIYQNISALASQAPRPLSSAQLKDISALAPLPSNLAIDKAPPASPAILSLQLLSLTSEVSLLEFRIPKKNIYRAHLSLLRSKMRRLENLQKTVEGEMIQIIGKGLAVISSSQQHARKEEEKKMSNVKKQKPIRDDDSEAEL